MGPTVWAFSMLSRMAGRSTWVSTPAVVAHTATAAWYSIIFLSADKTCLLLQDLSLDTRRRLPEHLESAARDWRLELAHLVEHPAVRARKPRIPRFLDHPDQLGGAHHRAQVEAVRLP